MASDLPAGFTLDEPAAPAAADVPAGFKLDETSTDREKALRAEYLKQLMAPGAQPRTLSGLITGQQPQDTSALGQFRDYSTRVKDAATLGLMRPLGGLMRGVSGITDPNSTFGERYRAGVGAEEDYANRAVANTPGALGVATDVIGSAASGGGVVPTGRAALSRMIGQNAVTGAVEGAARNAEDTDKAIGGAATGAALGAGTAAAVGSAAKLIPAVRGAEKTARAASQGQTPEELRDAAKVLYNRLDNAGIAYAQPQTATLKQGLDSLVASHAVDANAHPTLMGYFNKLDKLAQQPQGATFGDLHSLRSAIATQARGSDPSTRAAAGKIVGEIDKLVQGSAPAINPGNRDIKREYPQASNLWKSAALADDVSWIAGKAERKASSKAGVNPDEANRGAFRAVENKIDKPGAFDPYTAEQRQILSRIVEGDKLQNAARKAGDVVGSPVTRTVLGAGAGLLGLHTGGVGLGTSLLGGGAAVGGIGKNAFDRWAAARGQQNIDELLRNIATGSSAPLPTPRAALATLMAKRNLQRGAAAYGASGLGE